MDYIKGINLFNGLSSHKNSKKESKSSTHFRDQKNLKKKDIMNHKKNPNQILKEFY